MNRSATVWNVKLSWWGNEQVCHGVECKVELVGE